MVKIFKQTKAMIVVIKITFAYIIFETFLAFYTFNPTIKSNF